MKDVGGDAQECEGASSRSAPTATLPLGNWRPEVHTALCHFLQTSHAAGAAVFDWDNTSIYNDVSFAALSQLLDEKPSLHLHEQALHDLLPTDIGGVQGLRGGATLSDARADILEAHAQVRAVESRSGVGAAKECAAFFDLRALLAWYYDALEETPGIGAKFAYPWLGQLYAGPLLPEVEALAGRACAAGAAQPIGHVQWQTRTHGRVHAAIGAPAAATMPTGVRVLPEMVALMTAMRDAGWDVCVVSASCEPLVRGAARALGYPISSERIVGQRLTVDEHGRTTVRAPQQCTWTVPHREGKARLIGDVLGVAPRFVAGDTPGDIAMFHLPTVELGLVIDRGRDNELTRLADKPGYQDRILVQGRDDARGALSPGVPPSQARRP